MNKTEAHQLLDQVKAGMIVSAMQVQKALFVTGDISGLFENQKRPCRAHGEDVFSQPRVSGLHQGQGEADEEGPYGAVGRYARTRSI